MDRDTILARLRSEQPRLRALGVERLSLFGSVARDAAVTASDIDIAVRLAPDFSTGGFAYFGKLETLREALSDLLEHPVDLIDEPVRSPAMQTAIDRDRVMAFQ